MFASQSILVPIQEMTPGMIAEHRNQVIDSLVALASKELGLPERDLVIRDIQPYTDLTWKWSQASGTTVNNWETTASDTTVGYSTVTGAVTMADQRYVAIFGARDYRNSVGCTTATEQVGDYLPQANVNLIKFDIGGAIRAVWDITSIQAYKEMAGFAPGAVIIPQNAAFNISFYRRAVDSDQTGKAVSTWIQLIGVTVEPRGKVLSP